MLTGLVRSILTVSGRQAETLPALSTTRVSSVCVPSVATSAGEPDCTCAAVHAPLAVIDAGAPTSVPVSGSESDVVCQAVGAAALVLTGTAVSTL